MTKEEKAARKAKNQEILAEWKEEKKAKKQAKKEARALRKLRRKARPFWQKLISALVRLAAVGCVLALLYLILLNNLGSILAPYIDNAILTSGYQEADTELERSIIPADTEAQEAINAMAGYSQDDTWAIYLYVIGSNLESYYQNDLSEMVSLSASQEKQAIKAQSTEAKLADLQTFSDTISAAGLELPGPMYYIDPPKAASSTPVTDDVVVATTPGAASMDLDEITKVALPDNIKLVIRTGGATHWTNARINPNRVQTFLYSGNSLNEECNVPSYNMSSTEALADFLEYCNTNHDADHKVLILWDHGSGAFGFGVDEIYGSLMSIKDIGEALSKVYTANVSKPAFELIGFDACLMASAEVMDVLDGYGRYFAGSEETEPGFGWFYTDWLNSLVQNPGMNGAQLGLAIADSYMDFYARMSRNVFDEIGIPVCAQDDVTFSVLDIHKAAKAYDAYMELMEDVLSKAVTDDSVLTDVSQAAKGAIHYGSGHYYIINTIDLLTFMDGMPHSLETAVSKVQKALEDSVLYVRSASALEGSGGLSVFFPDTTTRQASIIYLMDYINSVCDNEAVNALYFYKAAGCLTEEMQTYLSENGYGEWKALDLTALKAVENEPVSVGSDKGYSVQVSSGAQERMTNVGLALGRIMDDKIVYYGVSADASLTEQGELMTGFDGRWICINGQPLSVEVAFNTAETITYHSNILIGKSEATLVFTYDKSTGEYSIQGAYLDDEAIVADFVGRNISDLTVGDTITPVYRCTNAQDMSESKLEGKAVRYGGRTDVSLAELPDGSYLSMITFNSIRGDEFNTGTVELTVSKGGISEMTASESYTSSHNR